MEGGDDIDPWFAGNAGDVANKGGADGGENDERDAGFIGEASHPAPAGHVLQNDHQSVGFAGLDRLEKGGQPGFIQDRLFFLAQFQGEALAGLSQAGAVFFPVLNHVPARPRPEYPRGVRLFQDGRLQAHLGTRAEPAGVNKIRVGLAGLGQGGEESPAEGQAGRGRGNDLQTAPPGEAAAALVGSSHGGVRVAHRNLGCGRAALYCRLAGEGELLSDLTHSGRMMPKRGPASHHR